MSIDEDAIHVGVAVVGLSHLRPGHEATRQDGLGKVFSIMRRAAKQDR